MGYHEGDCWLCMANFCRFHRTLQVSMIGFKQVWEMITHIRKCEEIIMIWNLVAWCNVLPWSGSLFEMAALSKCAHFLISAGWGCCHSLNVLVSFLTSLQLCLCCYLCIFCSLRNFIISRDIEVETKWPTFCRHFQTRFLEWKYVNFD